MSVCSRFFPAARCDLCCTFALRVLGELVLSSEFVVAKDELETRLSQSPGARLEVNFFALHPFPDTADSSECLKKLSRQLARGHPAQKDIELLLTVLEDPLLRTVLQIKVSFSIFSPTSYTESELSGRI